MAAKKEEIVFGIIQLCAVLSKMKLLSPVAVSRLFAAIYQDGMNLLALLRFAARTYGKHAAIIDDQETISFQELYSQAERLSRILKQTYGLADGRKVVFLCKNHASLVKALFAVSATGADIYLLHTDLSLGQLNQFLNAHDPHLLVYDEQLASLVDQSSYEKDKMLSYHDNLPAINQLVHAPVHQKQKLQRTSSSHLMLLTGGTTGAAKKVAHKPSLFNYLPPFQALLTRLQLIRYQSAYIATPIYHGYGIAILLLFIALGKKVILTSGFDAAKACDLIQKHKVEVVTVVPLMIDKMLKHQACALKSLACIASGGAQLNPRLIAEVSGQLGDVLYNLYGTSEAGLNVVATPQDLSYAPATIGRKIKGARLHVLDHNQKKLGAGEIGQFCIKNKWSMRNKQHTWIETGDVGYRDARGYYFLCGRTDDLVISAGVNIYPQEIEQVLIHHPYVADVAVVGVPDDRLGQRVKAIVQPAQNAVLTKETLLDWLRPRVATYQMPKEIVFVDQISYTHLGKREKKSYKGM